MNCELKIASRETARWLRKRRFNEPVTSYYEIDGTLRTVGEAEATTWNNPSHDKDARHQVYAAPTLAMAQMWLREKKRYDVLVDRESFFGTVGKYYAKIIRLKDGAVSQTGKYRTFDKALESGIMKALRTM